MRPASLVACRCASLQFAGTGQRNDARDEAVAILTGDNLRRGDVHVSDQAVRRAEIDADDALGRLAEIDFHKKRLSVVSCRLSVDAALSPLDSPDSEYT